MIKKITAISIAILAGLYLTLCKTEKPSLKNGEKATYKQTDECKALQTEIDRKNMYMSTSKAGPSAFEREALDKAQMIYEEKCKIK